MDVVRPLIPWLRFFDVADCKMLFSVVLIKVWVEHVFQIAKIKDMDCSRRLCDHIG